MYYCNLRGVMCDLVDHEDGTCAALRGCGCRIRDECDTDNENAETNTGHCEQIFN
jgi:hypothetical protein